MRMPLWGALCCVAATTAAAQGRPITFEEPAPVTITGFAVGTADYDRALRSNALTAGKIAVSLFKPVGDAYFFGQLTTALEDGETSTDIDNLLISWTPHQANQWTLAFGKIDAPIGFERDDEPLNFLPTNSFNFQYARPGKLTGLQVHYTLSPQIDLSLMAANGWDQNVDNNRGKTVVARGEFTPAAWITVGLSGVYGPERDSTDAHQRTLWSGDLTLQRGPAIVGAEVNLGREQNPGGVAPTWRGVAVTGFLRVAEQLGLSARYDQMEDPQGLLTGTGQILRSVTVGPVWFSNSAQEGIFSNVEHTTFHIPQFELRAALRLDRSSAPFFADAQGGLKTTDTRGVMELIYVF